MENNLNHTLRSAFILLLVFIFSSCVKNEVETMGTIYGVVNDSSNGEPISGAHVSISPSGVTTNTGSDGKYNFQELIPGQYTIQISKEGYKTNTKKIDVVAGINASGDMMLSKGISALRTSSDKLDFGTVHTSLSFKIMNIGLAGNIRWAITQNNANWLSLSSTIGSTDQGKESSVVVTIDRSKITKKETTIIVVEGNGESISVFISVDAAINDSKMELSTRTLNFGTQLSKLTFDIKNVGTIGNLDWIIEDVNETWLSFKTLTGSIAPNKQNSIAVSIDRSKVTKRETATVIIKANGESMTLAITADVLDPSGAIVESCDDGISMRVLSCKRNISTVMIEYSVENTGCGKNLDRWGILVGGNDVIVTDNLGNSYSNANNANYDVIATYAGKTAMNSTLYDTLPLNVVKKGTIMIKNFNADATSVTCQLFCMKIWDYSLARDYFLFKNIPIK